MKEILVNALPGVLALFLLDANHFTNDENNQEDSDSKQAESEEFLKCLPIVAPYGFNHRNINIDAIQQNSTYDYSLKDVYSKNIFPYEYNNNMISSIEDNIITPVIIVPFSVEKDGNPEFSDRLINILHNTSITDYV